MRVEKPAGNDHQVAHDLVVGKDSQHGNVAFLAAAHGNALAQRNHGRGRDDARHLLLRRLKVIDGKRVRRDIGDALASALVLGFNLVGADRLNLVQHILLAGHADGHNQDERSGADHHSQRGQGEANFIAAESFVGKTQDFAINHAGRTSFDGGSGGSPHGSLVRC